MKTLKKFTTSEGNELEFVTGFSHLSDNAMVVIDNSCLMERVYVIGRRQVLTWEDYDKEPTERTMIESFDQVINAWCNEEMHF